jgi:hypothetical protein
VEHAAPGIERLVGGEDHRALLQVALVHDVEEQVGGVVTARQVADLIDDEDVGTHVLGERFPEPTVPARHREVLDERGGGDAARVESVLDRAVGDGHGEMRLPAARLAGEDEAATAGDEVRGEERPDERQPDGRLEGEIEVVDGLQEREAGAAGELLEPRLLAVSDLLQDERGDEVLVGPFLLLGAGAEVAPHAAGVREVEALQMRVERDVRLHSGRTSCCGEAWSPLALVVSRLPSLRSALRGPDTGLAVALEQSRGGCTAPGSGWRR